VGFSSRAMETILSRKTKVQSWYLDVSMLANYWGQNRVYHHTGPINMTYALYEALRLIHEEGLENCHARHLKNHQALRAGLAAIEINYATQEGHILPQLNAVFVPAGLGAYKGKVWRIGLMGFGSRPANVLLFLSALEQLLAEQGLKFDRGASVAAANGIYSS
jgi:alanine-glyoxylate transaminase/serine-glyoxylate transaminase/serine-pyruvate transaminase